MLEPKKVPKKIPSVSIKINPTKDIVPQIELLKGHLPQTLTQVLMIIDYQPPSQAKQEIALGGKIQEIMAFFEKKIEKNGFPGIFKIKVFPFKQYEKYHKK